MSLGQLGALMFKHVEPTRHVCVCTPLCGRGNRRRWWSVILFCLLTAAGVFGGVVGLGTGKGKGWLVGWMVPNIGDAQQLETPNCIFFIFFHLFFFCSCGLDGEAGMWP